jgi:hypothetical protein
MIVRLGSGGEDSALVSFALLMGAHWERRTWRHRDTSTKNTLTHQTQAKLDTVPTCRRFACRCH